MSFAKIAVLYIITLVVFLGIDMLWLGVVSKSFYRNQLGNLLADQFNIIPALIFYSLFILGLMVFVIIPAINNDSLLQAVGLGVLFGFVAYATYDLSNLATLKSWPVNVVVVDLIWGMVISGTVCTIAYLIGHTIK